MVAECDAPTHTLQGRARTRPRHEQARASHTLPRAHTTARGWEGEVLKEGGIEGGRAACVQPGRRLNPAAPTLSLLYTGFLPTTATRPQPPAPEHTTADEWLAGRTVHARHPALKSLRPLADNPCLASLARRAV